MSNYCQSEDGPCKLLADCPLCGCCFACCWCEDDDEYECKHGFTFDESCSECEAKDTDV